MWEAVRIFDKTASRKVFELTSIQFNTFRSGSTYYYMTESAQSDEVKKMGEYLKSRAGEEDGLVDSTDEGIERARKGK